MNQNGTIQCKILTNPNIPDAENDAMPDTTKVLPSDAAPVSVDVPATLRFVPT